MFDSSLDRALTYRLACAHDCWGNRRAVRCGKHHGIWSVDLSGLDEPPSMTPSTDPAADREQMLAAFAASGRFTLVELATLRALTIERLTIDEIANRDGCSRQAVLARVVGNSRTALFLLEARAAAQYWSAFAMLVPPQLGFPGRKGRGATDVINCSLNYGYALLLNKVWLSVYHAGLEPSLGLLHTGRRRTPGLVFDLMEPFRQPLVDRAVLALIGRPTDRRSSTRARKVSNCAL